MTGAALAAFLLVGLACDTGSPASETTVPEPTVGTPPHQSTMVTSPVADQTPTRVTPPTAASAVDTPMATKTAAVIQPTLPEDVMVAADFPVPPDRDLPALARQLRWNGVEPDPEPARFAGQSLAVGDAADFWTLDYSDNKMVRKEFVLAAVSEHAYWWIERDLKVAGDDLQHTVTEAESRIYPRLTSVFGPVPGSAADPQRGHIINGRIPGLGGYVMGADVYPTAVHPYSNGVPAIYINVREIPLGSVEYLTVLTHELQHAIHGLADPTEATWLNEGLSELAVTEAGYAPDSIHYYLERTSASLVNWPSDLHGDVGRNYGAAALFAHYLRERHVPGDGLRDLLSGPDDGIAAVDAFLAASGAETASGGPADFRSVIADWMVANLLDQEDGRFGYAGLDVAAQTTRTATVGDDGAQATLAQYGVDYIDLKGVAGETTVQFEGDGVTPLLPAEVPEGGCWWTNRGDNRSSTLTRSTTVPAVEPGGAEPALTFALWHDIEVDWDYLYLQVSTDRGATWEVLPAEGTTDANPMGNSYGRGYTGSADWSEIAVPLTDYAGRDALLRFHYVTDDAINGIGACVRDLALSWETGRSDGSEWQADGFVMVNNRVRQDWIVWVIADGPEPAATRMQLVWDAGNQQHIGQVVLKPSGGARRWVVAVAPVAPATMERARYRIWAK